MASSNTLLYILGALVVLSTLVMWGGWKTTIDSGEKYATKDDLIRFSDEVRVILKKTSLGESDSMGSSDLLQKIGMLEAEIEHLKTGGAAPNAAAAKKNEVSPVVIKQIQNDLASIRQSLHDVQAFGPPEPEDLTPRIITAENRPSRVFIVAAGHSGTSALSNLLDLFGISHGPPEGDRRNPFWERQDLVNTNDHLLNPSRIFWNTADVKNLKITTEHLTRFSSEAVALLDRMDRYCVNPDQTRKCSWVLKDPRTTLTFRWWKCLLEPEPVILTILRHPLGVYMPPVLGVGYWKTRQLATIASTWGLTRRLLIYEEFLQDAINFANELYLYLDSLGVKAIHTAREEAFDELRKAGPHAFKSLQQIQQLKEEEKDSAAKLYDLIVKNKHLLEEPTDTKFMNLLSEEDRAIYVMFRSSEDDCSFMTQG
eukprot:TRINITY_DN4254_c0_g1::TRINITY_DN4254_c0_g1_i1::g.7942::m.7942 TRINITY_DN4254_c0_g1::TRINITY_DN4254_c0_g1_i1::g.7942  ORF type:complete len:426 (-),score=43.47,Sulfotransfer_3/PF13469.1/1e-08,Pyr_redox_3/PF13738.1/0.14 TRINITY_DN4254_c0_g1_i1:231-1508(-)